MENQPWEKAFLNSWKKNGHGLIIGYPHATINFWHLNYFHKFKKMEKFFSPDYIACNGPVALKYYNNLNSGENPNGEPFLISLGIEKNIHSLKYYDQ